jgi:hypothetical protein
VSVAQTGEARSLHMSEAQVGFATRFVTQPSQE